MLGEEVPHHHGQHRHDDPVDEVDAVEELHEPGAPGHPRPDEEEDQAQLPQGLQGGVLGHQAHPAQAAQVAEDQAHEDAPPGGGEGEVADVDAPHRHPAEDGQGQGEEAKTFHLDQPVRQGPALGGVHLLEPGPLRGQVGVGELGDELDKEDHPHHPKEVGDAIPHGDQGLQLRRGHGGLGRGKGRGGGEGPRQQAHENGGELVVGQVGEVPADEDAPHAGQGPKEDDHQPQADVGLEVLLEVTQEGGPGDEPHGGDEEHQAQVLHDL